MNFSIKHQEEYSRGELLLRSIFGFIYILIPHAFVLFFLMIGLMFINMIKFWVILITAKWPKGMFDYQVKLQRYGLRVNARMLNLADGYPAFGLNGVDANTQFDMPYKENIGRGRLLVRAFFGAFMLIPHFFVLYFRLIATQFVAFAAWFVILFTGKYPKGMFDFVVGTMRWGTRIGNYLNYYTDEYPPFTGAVLPGENTDIEDSKVLNDELLDDNF